MGKVQIEQTFKKLDQENKKAFIAYIVAGDGGLDQLKNQILTLEKAGVDIVELGIPFSDPVADGPIIQEAGQRAIKDGVSLSAILDELTRIKDDISIPVVFMSYVNPIFRMGYDTFAQRAAEANLAGVIIPDVPLEEEAPVRQALDPYNIAIIRLATLTSPDERLDQLLTDAEGFIYAVTIKGITGERTGYDPEVYQNLNRIKSKSSIPVCAGFGVSSKVLAEELGEHCDGVIVGSKIVSLFHEGKENDIQSLIP